MHNQNSIRSPALKEFWENIKEVGTLMAHCSIPERNNKQRLRNESCSRASLLLLCSHVERFFESLIVDILEFHEENNTPMAHLPIQLRYIQTWEGKLISESFDIDKRWKITNQIYKSPFLDDSETCKQGLFKTELILDGFASPGSSSVKKLFSYIGILDIWDSISQKTGRSKPENRLNELVGRRNGVAHGNSADKPTPQDVKLIIQDICELVILFNAVVVEYLIATFNPKTLWR
jgi:hypothetical protein